MRELSDVSADVAFVSSNYNKYLEAKTILNSFGMQVEFLKYECIEVQSDSLATVATAKAKDAFSKFARPVLVEDAGLFIDSLNGFPGPFSSYVFGTVGCKGILDLMNKQQNRAARFLSVVAYCDGYDNNNNNNHHHTGNDVTVNKIKLFEGAVHGIISESERGIAWGYDPIFIPKGSEQTFAESNIKDEISHRYLSLQAFARWYNQNVVTDRRV